MRANDRRVLAWAPRARGALRRATDVFVVVLVGPLVLLVVAALAMIVKLDSRGPVFYKSRRLGRGGRPFVIWKLRTMVEGAQAEKEALRSQSVLPWPDFKVENDPRVTRVGRVLRSMTLDELPQLWNVLRGEMTLVGPRPSAIPLTAYELWQTERLEVKPGIFGRWQATQRAAVDFDTRCRTDIAEGRMRSALRDVRVSVRTLVALIRHRGAH